MNKINKESLDLIKSFEGLVLSAYKDAVGVWTIGYGHTAMAGPPSPKSGMKISKAEAEALLLKDLVKYERPVKNLVKVPLNDNQYGALVSFVYNLGEGNFAKSTLLRKLNNKDYIGASNEFAKWNKAGGKVLRGLTRRRQAEKDLFLSKASSSPEQAVQEVPSVVVPEVSKPSVKAPKTLFELLADLFKKIFGGK